ncbi:MAG: ABC transporter permease [Actinobacteria bacterium]|nr:ABC transporter permease [Actinomycetota bacterium]
MTAVQDQPATVDAPASVEVQRAFPPPWLRRVGSWFLSLYAGLGLLYLFVPIAVIVAFSFNAEDSTYNIEWDGFTFDNWADPFAEQGLVDALVLSLKIAAIATAAAVVLGGLVALALTRYRFQGSGFVNLFLVLPLTTPEIVLGASLASLFIARTYPSPVPDSRGFDAVLIAHIMFCVSFVSLTVKARLRGFDWTLEDAAMDLGAGPVRTFLKVTFPLMIPGILAAALLSFALSLDDFIITLFNAGDQTTFPIYIYGAAQRAIPPQIQVLSSMILFASVAILVTGTLIGRRREAAATR